MYCYYQFNLVPTINHADNALIIVTLNWVLAFKQLSMKKAIFICVVIVRLIASNSPTSTTRHFIGGISKVKQLFVKNIITGHPYDGCWS